MVDSKEYLWYSNLLETYAVLDYRDARSQIVVNDHRDIKCKLISK